MTLWVCKGGKRGERESRFKENNLIAIGFNQLDNLSKVQTREELKALYEKAFPNASEGRKNNHVGQIYAFLIKVKIEDLVVVPMKTSRAIWVGKIISSYKFREDLGSDIKHTRNVEWLGKDIPRDNFDQANLYSFGSAMTFSKAERHHAEEGVKNVLKSNTKSNVSQTEKPKEIEEETTLDLEELATNQVKDLISTKFKGHELAWLVSGILEAQGFKTKVSPPGPDGGVDITASSGYLGLSEPKLCIQVKSQEAPVDVGVYRELRDKTTTIKATHGLLVSWGGFKSSVTHEAKNDVFLIQLWGPNEIIEELLKNYPKLSPEIKAAMPLKQIWIITESDEEE